MTYFSNLKGVEREQIWTSGADGSNAAALVVDASPSVFPHWTPDGAQIIYASAPMGGSRSSTEDSVASNGGSPQTLLQLPPGVPYASDVGSKGSLLYADSKGIESFDPGTRQARLLIGNGGSSRYGAPAALLWAPDQSEIAYSLTARFDGDPNAGLWVDDFKSAPRQIFHGWVTAAERGPQGLIYILSGSTDLNGALWTVDWHGRNLTRLRPNLPLLYDYFFPEAQNFSVSPDGRHIAFMMDDALQANIGLITFGK